DYWWTTMNKLNKYVRENNFDTIEFIHNTAIMVNDTAICGTRGWSIVTEKSSLEDKRFFEREKVRLVLSLEDAKKKNPKEIIVAMHYPPVERNNNNEDFLDIMREYGVKRCFYGHLHAAAHKYAKMGNISGINLSLVSCDYLNFEPLLI
ncbi:MAG: serine/threonine protein phosphatase, partial [Oscillospiraceae bacterium]